MHYKYTGNNETVLITDDFIHGFKTGSYFLDTTQFYSYLYLNTILVVLLEEIPHKSFSNIK